MAKLYVKMTPPPDVNKNTEWFMYPGVWTTYILILFFSWIIVLCLFGCTPGMAWTIVNLFHFVVTYHFFHWTKGTPFAEDQGVYNALTWWEQMDNGKQLTRNRKFLTVVPVVLRFAYGLISIYCHYVDPNFGLKESNGHKVVTDHMYMLRLKIRYLIASHTTDYQHPMLLLNTLAVTILVIAKFPYMHKVRIFGINSGK